MSFRGTRLLAFALAALASCKSAPEPAPEPGPAVSGAELTVPARELLDVCWTSFESSTQQVTLNFVKSGGRVQDIVFETAEGTPVSVGRCQQELAWLYPWPNHRAPDVLVLTPPPARPSGWVYLAYLATVNRVSPTREPGIQDPAPLVRACLEQGRGQRPHLRYRVRTRPVHVTQFIELSQVESPEARRTEADAAFSDTERCVQAVLASTVYSRARNFELELSDLSRAPAAASENEIWFYFDPEVDRLPVLAADEVKQALSTRQGQVAACWEAAVKRRSGLSGGRSIRFKLKPDGSVERVTVIANESDVHEEAVDYLLDRCLVQAVWPARFEGVGSVGATATYSWVFALRG